MIFSPSQLEEAAGRFQARFLLACLSSAFTPTVVYAASTQLHLVNLYRAMGSNKKDCLGACTTAASTLELITRAKPGILAMVDDLPEITLDCLIHEARKIHPEIRTFAIITKLDQLVSATESPILVADQDMLTHPETLTLAAMAIVTNTSYKSPSVLRHLSKLKLKSSGDGNNTFHLSLREQQLLEAYALGLSNLETAERLGLSVRTVQTYSSNLLQRLGVNNRQKALRRAIGLGLSSVLERFEKP
jgi:DNA-binding NarL/FixJ family response regulator